ncbi:MAG: UDPGP type 1 family protein [Lachnospiraceae bacterium]|nr:UDPGP type 1 family protein [Lachnospiraceae bacterium]
MNKGIYDPIPAMELKEISERYDELEAEGLSAIRRGEVAAVLLAGGMGTRLGFDAPKGTFNIGQNRPLYIFECLINNLKEVTDKAGVSVPLYIMTSDKNDEATRSFFDEHDYFGYPRSDIKFFKQAMAEAVDFEGNVLYEAPGKPATSPNGNGGWFHSLKEVGYDKDMRQRGVKWINIFAVDNVLQRICDPVFIGATVLSGKVSGSKVVSKAAPDERVGLLILEDGHPSIVEYYELPTEIAEEKDEDGRLKYRYGVILNYLFEINELERIVDTELPLHKVEKKIPYINESGELIHPEKPNGYKFELLILDMVRLMKDNLAFEVEREREFAPVKNLHGTDSVDSARELLVKNGVEI